MVHSKIWARIECLGELRSTCSDRAASRNDSHFYLYQRKNGRKYQVIGLFSLIYLATGATHPYPSVAFEPSTGSTARRAWSVGRYSSSVNESALLRSRTGVALDHPKRVLNLGACLGFAILDFALGLVEQAAFIQPRIGATPHRNLPDHLITVRRPG